MTDTERAALALMHAVARTGILGPVQLHGGEIRSETGLSHGEALAVLRHLRDAHSALEGVLTR